MEKNDSKYYYLQNKIDGELLMMAGYLVIFPNIEEAFSYREKFLTEDWRVKQCSKHLLDQ